MKQTTARAPEWACRIVSEVVAEEGRPAPVVDWWTCPSHSSSSGHYNACKKRIHISAGRSGDDQLMVLLHELAHWVRMSRSTRPPSRKPGHDNRYWEIAFDLYQRYDIMVYATHREDTAKAQAVSRLRAEV